MKRYLLVEGSKGNRKKTTLISNIYGSRKMTTHHSQLALYDIHHYFSQINRLCVRLLEEKKAVTITKGLKSFNDEHTLYSRR